MLFLRTLFYRLMLGVYVVKIQRLITCWLILVVRYVTSQPHNSCIKVKYQGNSVIVNSFFGTSICSSFGRHQPIKTTFIFEHRQESSFTFLDPVHRFHIDTHNKYDIGDWRAPRHVFNTNKAYLEGYVNCFPPSEPSKCSHYRSKSHIDSSIEVYWDACNLLDTLIFNICNALYIPGSIQKDV